MGMFDDLPCPFMVDGIKCGLVLADQDFSISLRTMVSHFTFVRKGGCALC
jgi:hypothetical protein